MKILKKWKVLTEKWKFWKRNENFEKEMKML